MVLARRLSKTPLLVASSESSCHRLSLEARMVVRASRPQKNFLETSVRVSVEGSLRTDMAQQPTLHQHQHTTLTYNLILHRTSALWLLTAGKWRRRLSALILRTIHPHSHFLLLSQRLLSIPFRGSAGLYLLCCISLNLAGSNQLQILQHHVRRRPKSVRWFMDRRII